MLNVRAFVALGSLSPDDVDVQVVHGVIASEDALVGTTVDSLTPAEAYDGGRFRFDGNRHPRPLRLLRLHRARDPEELPPGEHRRARRRRPARLSAASTATWQRRCDESPEFRSVVQACVLDG